MVFADLTSDNFIKLKPGDERKPDAIRALDKLVIRPQDAHRAQAAAKNLGMDLSKLTVIVVSDEAFDKLVINIVNYQDSINLQSSESEPSAPAQKSSHEKLSLTSDVQEPLAKTQQKKRRGKVASGKDIAKALQEKANQETADRIRHRKETAREKREENERIEKEIIAKDLLKSENLAFGLKKKEVLRREIRKQKGELF